MNGQNSTAHTTFTNDIRTNSNALVYLNDQTASNFRTNSNALVYLDGQNTSAHNTINTSLRTSSNALVYLNGQNSTAHTTFTNDIRTNSHALVYLNRTTSNSLSYLSINGSDSPLARATSHALVYLDSQNTSAHNTINTSLRTSSNALVYLNGQNSTAHTTFTNDIRTSSNTLVYLDGQNTSAHNTINTSLRTSSNALVYLNGQNSTAHTTFTNDIRNNSNATNSISGRVGALESDGSGIISHTTHVNYETDTTLSQPVLIKQGVTVAATKTLGLDITLPISGNINLSGSGILQLNGDLIFDSGTYLTSGGIIKGEGNTLLLTSSFVIPPSSRLKIMSNMVIDGQGNNLITGQGARLIVDPSVSVTLRNITWFNNNSAQHLEMRADTSNLTLDNVDISFDRNFNFTQGRLFIDNDVMVTGTNTFAYSSIKPLYIEPFGTLRFDIGTTFSYSPYESRPHTATERNLLRLVDRSSMLYLDGCSINLPDAGMQLTRGTVCFDNKVIVNGNTTAIDEFHCFEFGDGISEVADVEIKVLSGANVNVNGLMYHHPEGSDLGPV